MRSNLDAYSLLIEKHDVAVQIVDKDMGGKDGVEVVFLPGVLLGKSEIKNAQESIVHTTCIGMRTQK